MLPEVIEADDFANCNWRPVLDEADTPTCERYRHHLADSYRQAVDANDVVGSRVFGFLAAITSFHLQPRKAHEPFGAMFTSAAGRSPILDDLTDLHLDALDELLPGIDDPELAARCGDVLWLVRRDPAAARRAVDAYLASGERVFAGTEWFGLLERYERALRVAVFLGRASESFIEASSRVRTLALSDDERVTGGLPYQLMRLLLEFSRDQPETLLPVALRHAEEARTAGNTILERKYLRQAATWATEAGEEAEATDAKVRCAEAYVREADTHLAATPPNSLVGVALIRKAIQEYRTLGGSEERIEELNARLPGVQFDALGQLAPIEAEIDGRELAEAAIASVSEESWVDALFKLALISSSPRYDRLREQVLQEAADNPMQYLWPAQILDDEGRLAFEVPALLTAEGEAREHAIDAAVSRRAAIDRHITLILIHAARRQIQRDHRITESDVFQLVEASPLVPWGHERLFARGLAAGLTGDLVVSGHLLATQLEKGIRGLLALRGVVTSTLLADGIQKARSLDWLLSTTEAEEVFGKDAVFDLRDLLVLPYGSNLRNRIAHGLLNQAQFLGGDILYLWWLSLRLCLLPLLRQEAGGIRGPAPAVEGEAEEE